MRSLVSIISAVYLCIAGASADPLIVFFIDPTYDEYSGDAMLVCTPGGENYLVDGGMFTDYPPAWDCGLQRILPLLDSLQITSLDGIVATHPDADHIGGLISVLDSIPVGTVWDSGWPYGSTWTYGQFLTAVWNNGADYVTPRRGDILDWGPELTVEVIHPVEPLDPSSDNNSSITIRLTYGDISFLFTGDLETDGGEDVILAAVGSGVIGDISADVLKVAHHGSFTSTCDAWLDAVAPSVACIEVGADNPYGHPHWEVIYRLESRNITIHRTDLEGTFYLSTEGDSLYCNTLPPSGGGGGSGVDGLIAYPSPAASSVTFAWETPPGAGGTLRVYNLLGEIVYETPVSGGSHLWDLSVAGGYASPGLYMALLVLDGGGPVCEEYFAVLR